MRPKYKGPDRREESGGFLVISNRISVGIILALLAHLGGSLWWGATLTAKSVEHDQHLQAVDDFDKKSVEVQEQMVERLTRLEEKQSAEQKSLDRIEALVSAPATAVTPADRPRR